MNDWKRATRYFFLGYLAATFGGFALYYIASTTAMWLFTMTVMPALYVVLAYKYFRKNLAEASPFFDPDVLWLITYWVGLSLLMDTLVYVLLAPVSLGSSPNWAFFREQSPWIWINYTTIILIVLVARWFYYRKKEPRMSTHG
jgi:membrane protease YdiL (CAAX protease family)